MATIVDMPKLSDTMTVGTLLSWQKKVGDTVAADDIIAEIESDKATMELESFDDGIILATYINEGDEIAVGKPLCAIGEEGETVPSPTATKNVAKKSDDNIDSAEKSPTTVSPSPKATNISSDERIKASPLAKKIAHEQDISLETIQGTGPKNRIIKNDVLQAISKKPSPLGKTASSKNTPLKSSTETFGEEKNISVTNLRATIAQRLVESKTQLPHFYLEIEVDASPLLQLRANLNTSLAQLPSEKGGMKLTVNDFILKASIEAIRRNPTINRSWMGSMIRQHGSIHLAFGVAIDQGLLTPVIRDAHNKSLREISAEAKTLAEKARNRKLTTEEMTGSTFTVTNLGMFGINHFYGIINPPNAAILSVGATIKKPVVNKKEEIVITQCMNLGLSGDHRVIDGAVGAQFLSALKEIIENPALMLV